MNESLVNISKTASVNPRHAIAVIFDPKKLQTVVVMVGGAVALVSDYKFTETVGLLNGNLPTAEEKKDA